MAEQVELKELLEAGIHFGHQTRRWNPNMRRFIHGETDGIHIIDLLQTQELLGEAQDFVAELSSKGGTILFVGTKKQAQDPIREWATKAGMPYVNQRWLGGLMTNFNTISVRIRRLHELTELQENGQLDLLPTKERMNMQAELAKLEYNLGGVRDMERVPDAVFVIDLKTEEIGVREARRLRIPVIGLVDSNCDPNNIDYVIPGNDDSIRSCGLIVQTLGTAIEEGAGAWRTAEALRQAEEDERRRKEAEERRKREEEDKARREAEALVEAERKAAADKLAAEARAVAVAEQAEAAAKAPKPKPKPKKATEAPVAHPQKVAEAPAAHPQKIAEAPEAPAAEPDPQKVAETSEADAAAAEPPAAEGEAATEGEGK